MAKRFAIAAISGNFHIAMLDDALAIITDAAGKVHQNYEAITMIARVIAD